MHDEHEFDEHTLPADLAALEKQLAAFAPMAPRVDRDRLMFAAGRASVGHSSDTSWAGAKFWPAATVLATAASVLLATMLVWQRAETVKVAEQPAMEAVEIAPTLVERDKWRWPDRLPSGYLGDRQVALTRGVGALEPKHLGVVDSETDEPAAPATARQLLEELLPATQHTRS